MEREQEMLNQLTQYMEKYQNLNLQDINKMTLKEVNNLINELSKIRDEAALLYDQMRDYESLGEYNVDELQDFYRKYFDFENDMEKGFLSLGNRKTNIKEYLADLLKEYREAEAEVYQIQGNIEKNEFEIMDAKSKIETIERQIEYIDRAYSDSIAKGDTNSKEAYEKEANKLRTELSILNERVPGLERELEALNKKLAEQKEKVNKLGQSIEDYKSGKKVIKSSEEKDEEEKQEKSSPSIFDMPDDNPALGNQTSSSQLSHSDEKTIDTPVISDDEGLLPINEEEIVDIYDGKEYIVELDKEATMDDYRASGYSKNAFGWYFDPSTNEYVEGYDPLKDPLFQVFKYYEVVNVLNKEATMDNYRASGYSKNAFGWYFDPSTNEYVEGYDPLKDPLFQVFDKKKKYVGKGLKGQVPTKGEENKKDPEKDPEKKDPEKKDPEIEDEEKKNEVTYNVTMNITGPEDKKTTIVIPAVEGKPLFERDENGKRKDTVANRMFANACRETFGADGHYKIKECVSDVEGFDLYTTPVKQDMTIDAVVGKYRKVTFTVDDNTLETIYVEDGKYLDPNLIEKIDRAVNYGYNDVNEVEYQGKIKDQRDGNALKKAFTGLKYWGVAGSDDKLDKFKFDQPITGDVNLVAKTGVKAKTVLSTASGLATGATIDLAGGPVAGRVTMAAAGLADRIVKYKLNHHKEMIGYDEIAKMTGIKKANAKLKNYFRKTQNLKDLQYYFRSVMIGAASVEVGRGVKQIADYLSNRNATPSGPSVNTSNTGEGIAQTETQTPTLKNGDQFQYGYRDSYSAVGGNNSVHLNPSLTGQSTPHSFYDTVNRQWLPINDSTLAQVAADPTRYGVRYMSEVGDMMWEPAVEALENVGGMTL